MTQSGKLEVTTPSPTEIRVERTFDAPAQAVFYAHTQPAILMRWMLGPGDWSMPQCEIDLRVGGACRYLWRHPEKGDMGMSGEIIEIEPPARLVQTERFDEAWYPGECINTSEFGARDEQTRLVVTMRYESEAARNVALDSPMAEGMEVGYARLDAILADG